MKNYKIEGIPTLEEAKILLKEAGQLNPGSWVEHSIYAGRAAELIAKDCCDMDSDKALILGMLHDIGRRVGVTGMRHLIDGFTFANDIVRLVNGKSEITDS